MKLYGMFGSYPDGLRITIHHRPHHRVTKAFGIGWRTGFVGLMLTEPDTRPEVIKPEDMCCDNCAHNDTENDDCKAGDGECWPPVLALWAPITQKPTP